MNRGEIWLVGRRPALIVSSERMNRTRSRAIIVVPLTTHARGIATHVEVEAAGLDETSYAVTEQITVTAKTRLIHRLAEVDARTMQAVDAELRSVLGL